MAFTNNICMERLRFSMRSILQWAILFGGITLNDYFQSLLKTINDSINKLDGAKFDEVCSDIVNALKKGHKPIITGLGKNVPICEKFEGTMLSLGLEARFLHTNTAAHGDLGVVKEGDVVLILSKSGETAESIYLLKQLKKRNVTIWAVTFSEWSTLSREAEKTLSISMDNEGDRWNVVPNNSTTLYLIILQAIAMTVADKLNVSLDDFRINHPGGHIGRDSMQKSELILSRLPKTWLIDIDGTIVKHNGFLIDGHDTLLSGSKEFINNIPEEDRIILLTARGKEMKDRTEAFLRKEKVRFDDIIFNLPAGERIIINDMKPSGLNTSIAVNLRRDLGLKIKVVIDENL